MFAIAFAAKADGRPAAPTKARRTCEVSDTQGFHCLPRSLCDEVSGGLRLGAANSPYLADLPAIPIKLPQP
ncbi:hypothetical protein GCM10009304_28170 [Pseudomonas matsuisoli]|uniref:Uncharacterized protein n=1 Tax=Pseudomonas matsuisoli TaxID=1515666 RepID=A0A917PYY6_9PSED|nr:hypothetical protein GCM10009304_28170 [Pseudomonas matsuisoli]